MSRTVRPAARKFADDVPELPPRLRVEAGRRLVEEQQLRVADQGARDRQPLPLPAGELDDVGPGLLLQRDAGDRLVRVEPARVEGAEQVTVSRTVSLSARRVS